MFEKGAALEPPLSVYRIIFIGRLRVWGNRSIIKNARKGWIYPMEATIKHIYC